MSLAKQRNQFLITEKLRALASDLGIAITVALVLIAVYLIDTMTPLGEPVWILYFIPLILSYWSSRHYAIPVVCIVTLLFLIHGFFLSPEGISANLAVVYRYTFFIVFIAASIILWAIRWQQFKNERL